MSASKAFSPFAEGERLLDLDAYLDALGLAAFAPVAERPGCELCGHGEALPLRGTARVADGLRVRFATLCCARCGLMFQSPRFAPSFYAAYYARTYRLLLGHGAPPGDAYMADQFARGAALYDSLSAWLPERGRLLDVGCGAGGLMRAFLDQGWQARGFDPDEAAVAHGAGRWGLPVEVGSAENMAVESGAYDLIVITGSLEHVGDPHAVLRACHAAAAPGALLLLEAHGLGQAAHVGAIGHNHRRLLTGPSMALWMLCHGWQVEWITDRPLCGPTRPGSVFALGRRLERVDSDTLAAALRRGVGDRPEEMAALLDRLAIR